jgi:hypothetical protein
VAILLIALVGVWAANYSVGHKALRREVDRRLATEASAIMGMPGAGAAAMAGRIDDALTDHHTADLYYMLVDRHGHKRAGNLDLRISPQPGYWDFDEQAHVSGVGHGRALTRRLAYGGTLVVLSDNDAIDGFDGLMIRVQREVAEALQAVAEDAGDSLAISVDGPVPIRGDVHRLRQTIVNLVENAIRHTPPGTAMTVEARVSARDGLLIVSDNGPGIPAGQHEAVIRRFARLESAGGRAGGRAGNGLPETAGQGLGLTLVDAIARLHHGVLIMQDAAPGLRVVIALPLGA